MPPFCEKHGQSKVRSGDGVLVSWHCPQCESGAPRQPGATQPEHEGVAHNTSRSIAERACNGGDSVGQIEFMIDNLLERMARLVVEEARAIAETNAGKPGEVIHCQGDVQTFCAGMSESMRRIYKALGILLTPDKLQQLREAVERT